MIYDTLENLVQLSRFMPALAPMRKFLSDAAVYSYEELTKKAAEGAYTGLDLRFSEYSTKPDSEVPFEAHKRLWDMQIVLEGEEKFTVLPLNNLTERTPYDEKRDIAFYDGIGGTDVILKRGYASAVGPWDGHRPGAETERGTSHIKKIVVKFSADEIE